MTVPAAPATSAPAVPAAAAGTRATPFSSPVTVTVLSAEEVVGTVRIGMDEPYLEGHYPDYAVLPGVFVVDAAYDAVRVLAGAVELAEIRALRFRTPVRPGDVLDVHCLCTGSADGLLVTVTASADGVRAATAQLRFRTGPDAEAGVPPLPAPDRSTGAGAAGHAAVRVLLPHRYPMLLVDRVVDQPAPDRIVTVKAVSGSEPCYSGLAEGLGSDAYAYPPALLMESWGQGAGVLWMRQLGGRDGALILAEVRGVRFHRTVQPGDVLHQHVRIDHVTDGALFFSGESWLGDQPVASVRSAIAVMRRTDTVGRAGPMTDVVVTGLGVVSPLGHDPGQLLGRPGQGGGAGTPAWTIRAARSTAG